MKKSGQANLALFLYFFTEKSRLCLQNLFSLIVMKSTFPPCLTFLASVFRTFLTRFSDPGPAGYLEEFKVLT